MLPIFVLAFLVVFSCCCGDVARAETKTAGPARIEWEVKNRFRLFRSEADFERHVDAMRHVAVLAAERRLAKESDGRGWAGDIVERLCLDRAGRLLEFCDRDGERENYLAPRDHRVGVTLAGTLPANEGCVWSFDDGDGHPRQVSGACDEEVKARLISGRPTLASVDIVLPDGTALRLVSEILVRDVLIAGMGDSVAAGEGNPDRAVQLSDQGFCFKRFGGGEYYRPGRAGFSGNKACTAMPNEDTRAGEWAQQSARWLSGPCHRSLYSYQLRTALALAVRYPHIAVTYLPLACTGATIADGLFGSQRARECLPTKSANTCSGTVNGQLAELRDALAAAKRRQPERQLDLVLLSIGANDIYFSGLVADVIVDTATERTLFRRSGAIATVDESRDALRRTLPQDFAKLREALKPLVGGDLSHVIYTAYANPALSDGGTPCPGGRAGFDIHPAFNAAPQRLANVAGYVQDEFLPQLKALALCQSGILCKNSRADRMTFVDAHQDAFASHGFCARAQTDPAFDRQCFAANGESFDPDIVTAANQPMLCGRSAGEYRAYLPRARWIRDANDSYFAAMTYPQGLPASMQPSDIHDASWGILSAVYGGAVHPSAEGHAAMADAAAPVAAAVLQLDPGVGEVISQPVQPINQR